MSQCVVWVCVVGVVWEGGVCIIAIYVFTINSILFWCPFCLGTRADLGLRLLVSSYISHNLRCVQGFESGLSP